jgi:hypothetical protein
MLDQRSPLIIKIQCARIWQRDPPWAPPSSSSRPLGLTPAYPTCRRCHLRCHQEVMWRRPGTQDLQPPKSWPEVPLPFEEQGPPPLWLRPAVFMEKELRLEGCSDASAGSPWVATSRATHWRVGHPNKSIVASWSLVSQKYSSLCYSSCFCWTKQWVDWFRMVCNVYLCKSTYVAPSGCIRLEICTPFIHK